MSAPHPLVRRASVADIQRASAVLADAFSDYPWTRWTVAADDHEERVRNLQRLAMERIALPHGEIWVAIDSDGAIASVAVWMLPTSTVPAAAVRAMAAQQATFEGSRHEASIRAEEHVASLRPTSAHYYLGAVGTRRDCQRNGFGSAVLVPVLERARAETVEVFLETSSPENVEFYAALGFETVAETDLPGGGPHVWAMVRP